MMPYAYRRCLAMLRCASLPLQIGLGHRSNTPLANITCKLCEQDVENGII